MDSRNPYANCRRADAHGQGLTIAHARSDAPVEHEIVTHTIDRPPRFTTVELEDKDVERLREAAINNAIGIGDEEGRPTRERIGVTSGQPADVHPRSRLA
jgi:hypothetical protein